MFACGLFSRVLSPAFSGAVEEDIATTTEGDGIAVGIIAVGLSDRGVQVRLITGADGDGQGRLGVGRPRGEPTACQQADQEHQGECDEPRPGRKTKGVPFCGVTVPPDKHSFV